MLYLAESAARAHQTIEALRVFGAVALVAGIALLLTSRRLAALRRRQIVAALISGGWVAIATGFLLGPHALNVVRSATLLEVRPLLILGLGWVGLIIGLQAHRAVVKLIPNSLWRWVALDGLLSFIVIAALTSLILVWGFPTETSQARWIFLPAITLGVCAMGWSPETRSIRARATPEARRLGLLIQAGAGLSGMLAILVFGLLSPVTTRAIGEASPTLKPALAIGLLVAAIVLGGIAGFGGRWLIRQAGRDRPQLLVVMLGLIALISGIAAELGFSPLLAAMLAGLVLVNAGKARLVNFEHLIHKAEHPMAMLFYLLAGILLDPRVGAWGVVLIVAVIGFRFAIKPLVMSSMMGNLTREVPKGGALDTAPIRQAPLAIALAVALVLDEPSALSRQLLAVIALVGLVCDLVPILISIYQRRIRHRELTTAAATDSSEATE